MTEQQEKAKNYLYNIANVPNEIDVKKLELERLRDMATGMKAINYDKDVVQSSPEDRMSESIIKIIELMESISDDVTRYSIEYSNALLIFDLLDNDESQILQLHFFQHKTFYQIASLMHMSERNVMYTYSSALEHFAEKM